VISWFTFESYNQTGKKVSGVVFFVCGSFATCSGASITMADCGFLQRSSMSCDFSGGSCWFEVFVIYQNHLKNLLNRLLGPTSRNSNLVDLGLGPIICIATKFPGGADTSGPDDGTLRTTVLNLDHSSSNLLIGVKLS
jgi:hypothetical protein